MSLDSISTIGPPLWLLLTVAVFLVAMSIIGATMVLADKRSDILIRAAAVVLCVGAAFGLSALDSGRTAAEKVAVVDGFAHAYGLQLDDRDLEQLVHVGRKDVTRNLETADGSLKQVLFRVVDDKVLPYTMDVAGSWTPMQVIGDAQ